MMTIPTIPRTTRTTSPHRSLHPPPPPRRVGKRPPPHLPPRLRPLRPRARPQLAKRSRPRRKRRRNRQRLSSLPRKRPKRSRNQSRRKRRPDPGGSPCIRPLRSSFRSSFHHLSCEVCLCGPPAIHPHFVSFFAQERLYWPSLSCASASCLDSVRMSL